MMYRRSPAHFHSGSPSSRRLRLSEMPAKWTWTFCARSLKRDFDPAPGGEEGGGVSPQVSSGNPLKEAMEAAAAAG